MRINKPVYNWLFWKELLCNINMPWKGVEKAQNICFSKHEKLVISYGKKEVGKQFFPPSENNWLPYDLYHVFVHYAEIVQGV